jgi:hypothetical protein
MAQRQRTGEQARTVSSQWTKSEKREQASREIMEARKRTHLINKKFAQLKHMQ